MECASEFRELASHNPFIQELEDDGYDVEFVGAYLVIYGIPFLDKNGALRHGDWISPVDLKVSPGGLKDWVIDTPSTHQAWFRGGRPHDKSGRELGLGIADIRVTVTEGFITDHSFSFKLKEAGQMRQYHSFEEKVRTYLEVITAPAMAAYQEATPLRAIEKKAVAQGSPLRFPDTLSSRYHINDVSSLLRGKKVAIVGLGGTGSYILDFIARTHLQQIALFDDDKVHVHTIFRIPGFIPRAIGGTKVEALAQQYGNWHGGVLPIAERITSQNIERLGEFDFVFVSVDDGPARRLIVEWLSSKGIPFVDCGMGLNRSVVGLNGTVRITGVDRRAYERTVDTAYLPTSNTKDDEYRRQAQIAELNALNAALAVIRFKQHFKLFDRLVEAAWYTFETAPFELESEVAPK
jgi:ThiF family